MKRYLAFYGSVYYPGGGMNDFLSDHDTIDEAIKVITNKHNKRDTDEVWEYAWGHIYDTTKKVKVWKK